MNYAKTVGDFPSFRKSDQKHLRFFGMFGVQCPRRNRMIYLLAMFAIAMNNGPLIDDFPK
jgi:hypothetical protein